MARGVRALTREGASLAAVLQLAELLYDSEQSRIALEGHAPIQPSELSELVFTCPNCSGETLTRSGYCSLCKETSGEPRLRRCACGETIGENQLCPSCSGVRS
jgi:predicted RNA-binding Zn-ribbon protein involved in translation (DUF1610 family)